MLYPGATLPGTKKDARLITLTKDEAKSIVSSLFEHCHSEALLRARSYKLPGESSLGKWSLAIMRGEDRHRLFPKFKACLPDEAFKATPDPQARQAPTPLSTRTSGAPQPRVREAIVIDCEMVACDDHAEVAYLSAIDFLTGEVLIDCHVQPTAKVTRWNTRISGISVQSMKNARLQGKIIYGWQQARERLWKFANSETVFIGHSLQNDLNVLGIHHPRIVDSSILTSEAVYPDRPKARTWSLKTLVKEFLGHDIQTGKRGHDALEDARATRDVVIWCLQNPERLKSWAAEARVQEEARMEALRIKTEQEQHERVKKKQEREQQELLKLRKFTAKSAAIEAVFYGDEPTEEVRNTHVNVGDQTPRANDSQDWRKMT